MHPAYSVIFLTTLIGVGQGLFLALYTGQVYSLAKLLPPQDSQAFYAVGSLVALIFLGGGLAASFFHLGRPERAWRSAAKWRTSWLSREVIVLPAFMAMVFLYGVIHFFGLTETWFVIQHTLPVDAGLVVGFIASVLAFALFVSTAMIYASLKFLQEWHSPLTVANYTLLGIASGFMLAAAFSAYTGADLLAFFGTWAVIFTLAGLVTRVALLIRNARIKHKIDLQAAIGVRHGQLSQMTQGFLGNSFNTREFFHGKGAATLLAVRAGFLLFGFALPIGLITGAYLTESAQLPILAFVSQLFGLMLERWYFFAEAKHPQNLYYQRMA